MTDVEFFHTPMTCVVLPSKEYMLKSVWKECDIVEGGVHKWVVELVNLKHNPNQHHEGKRIIVLRNNFKGYTGWIVSTSLDGTAVVELDANLQKEHFKLMDLSYL